MANVTGELGGQPIILENAASEATLYALLQATLATNSNKSEAAKIQKAYEDAVKKSTREQIKNLEQNSRNRLAMAEELARREALNKKIEEEKEKRKQFMQGLAELGQLVGKGLGAAFGTATPKVSDFTDALSGIPVIGPIIGAVGKAMQDQIEKFRELSTVGADFGGNIDYVRQVAKEAGLSLETYTKTVTENGVSLAMLGGNTTEGAKIFNAVNKSLQGPFQQSLARLGFSMEETAEYTAGYLAQQTKLGRAQRMTQQELNEGTEKYLLELDMLARVHGMTRKEAQAQLDAQLNDKRIKMFLAQLGNADSPVKHFLASIPEKDKEFRDAMTDLIINNGIPSATNQMANEIAVNNPMLRELAVRLNQHTISVEEANAVMRKQAAVSTEFLGVQGKNSSMLNNLTGSYGSVHAVMMEYGKFGSKAADAAGAQADASGNAGRNMANLDKALLDLRNTAMDLLQPAFVVMAGAIESAIPAIGDFITKLATITKDEGIKQALIFVVKEIGSILGSALADMITSPAVVGALLVGVGLLWGGVALKMAMVKGINDLFESAAKKGMGPQPGQYADWQKGKTPEGPSSKLPEKAGKGMLGRLGGLLKGGGLLGLGGMGVEYIGEKVSEAGHTKTGAALDIAGSTAKYAGLGALLGSVIPGLGTVIGGGIGATVGLGAGLFSSGGKLFSSDSKPATNAAAAADQAGAADQTPKDMQVAAQIARTTTPAQVRDLAAALKELDYNKLIIPEESHKSMETGVLKMRQLRGEVIAMTAAFKDLNNTGLDKITQGLGRLDESFKSFNKSFVEDFITKFKELDKKSQEQLLTDLNEKMDMLNTSVQSLVELEEENSKHHKNTARNTRATSGRVN